MLLKLLIGAGIGALIGGVLGSTRSCETGGCPLTANPTRGALVGGIFGLMLAAGLTSPSQLAVGEDRLSAATAVGTLNELAASLAAHEGKALVVFSAPWCPACRQYEPRVQAAAAALGPAARFFKVDTDKARDLAAHFEIKYLPTSVVFEHGLETSRFVGVKESDELVKLLGGTHEH